MHRLDRPHRLPAGHSGGASVRLRCCRIGCWRHAADVSCHGDGQGRDARGWGDVHDRSKRNEGRGPRLVGPPFPLGAEGKILRPLFGRKGILSLCKPLKVLLDTQ